MLRNVVFAMNILGSYGTSSGIGGPKKYHKSRVQSFEIERLWSPQRDVFLNCANDKENINYVSLH